MICCFNGDFMADFFIKHVYTLGRLTKEQIKAGYSALQCIASCVDKSDFGAQLTAACNDFYTRIPHYFGCVPCFVLLFFFHSVCKL